MTVVAAMAILLSVILAYRVELVQRLLRKSGVAIDDLRDTIAALREQLAKDDAAAMLEWDERLLLSAVKAEFIAHQRFLRSGPRGDMSAWIAAKNDLDNRVDKLLIARGEMPTPAQMRAELRASLPPDQMPALRDSDITPVQGMVVK